MSEIILCVVIAVQAVFHYVERRDLYNRIMSRDYTEYKRAKPPGVHPQTAHERALRKWKGDE